MLEDLEKLIEQCRAKYESLAYKYKYDVRLDNDLRDILLRALEQVGKYSSSFDIHPFSIEILEQKSLMHAFLPSLSLWFGYTFWPLDCQLIEYRRTLDNLKTELKTKEYSVDEIDKYLRKLPDENWNSIGDRGIGQAAEKIISELPIDKQEKIYFIKFLSIPEWYIKPLKKSDKVPGKKFDRGGDIYDSVLMYACGLIAANSSKFPIIIRAFVESQELRKYFDDFTKQQNLVEDFMASKTYEEDENKSHSPDKGINKIFYGAPGVGKSYKVNEVCNDENSIRTIFHPDTQYTDFAGCLKPVSDDGNVSYQFRPGPFVEALDKAVKNFPEHTYLVIEEINRAPAAAVFGEIFQLLDRDENGQSIYPISISDFDMLCYLKNHVPDLIKNEKLVIPPNLSILAAMNSSDQAVMPMDTAFKRRWIFEYIPIDFTNAPEGVLQIPVEYPEVHKYVKLTWTNFALVINDILSEEHIPEDRLLGPWFLGRDEIESQDKAIDALSGKLLLYLWDDVLRHNQQNILFNNSIKNYGMLIAQLKKGKSIFNENVERLFDEKRIKDNDQND